MKLSYNWLKELLPNLKLSPVDLADLLNLHVAEVEGVEMLGKDLRNIVVGEILRVMPHPKADKLQIAKVKTIINNKLSIINVVCGAPNIKKGQKVPLALPGATLLDGLVIKRSDIRGVISEGMLCAEDELGIGEDRTGIFILPPKAKIGQDVKKVLGLDDTVIEVSNTSLTHRPDLFSHVGMAREISALTGKKLKKIKVPTKSAAAKNVRKFELQVEVEDEELCPRYMAVVMNGIKIKPSPQWLENRLRNVGIRPINNVVDATNYVLAELGQPLHAFDANKLVGGKIVVRCAKKGEKMVTLDGEERELSEDMLVIADDRKPVALAGVMGGANSEIGDSTRTIVIESANFAPVSIRRTARKLGLWSESSLRFEKGLPLSFPEDSIARAIELIKELAGGKVASPIIDKKSKLTSKKLEKRKKILLDVEKVNKFIGQNLDKNKIIGILRSLQFEVKELDLRSQLIRLAKEQLGRPYKYGSRTFLEAPEVFDCSSLTRFLYRQIGIEIPRPSREQMDSGQVISLSEIRPGDLVFSKPARGRNLKPPPTGHVGIFVGENRVIHATAKDRKVAEISLKDFSSKKGFLGARRILSHERGLVVTVPVFRSDVEIEEDLIEEIVRIFGFEKIVPRPIEGVVIPTSPGADYLVKALKNILAGLGFDEVYNYSFYGSSLAGPDLVDMHLKLANPLNPDQAYLRMSLLPRLLENTGKNIRNFEEFKIFEIGKIYQKISPRAGKWARGVDERKMVAGVICEKSEVRGVKYEEEPFYQVKGVVEVLLDRIGFSKDEISWQPLEKYEVRSMKYEESRKISDFRLQTSDFLLDPVKSAGVYIGKELVGVLGEISQRTAGDYKIKGSVGLFELDFEKLIKYSEARPPKFESIPAYPPAIRDLGFVVDRSLPYKDLVETIKKVSPLIKKAELFDIYVSEKLGKNKKNLAFRLTFQSSERTLKLSEVDEIQKKIVDDLEKKFGAKLRTF